MPPKKTAKINNFTIVESRAVPIDELKPFDKNPRRGDIEGIRESLRDHGQFRRVIVNTRKGAETEDTVIAGNHTRLAAKAEGWTEVLVDFIDVDDEEAFEIMLVDNRLNDKATYNTDVLAEVLKARKNPSRTGYDPETVNQIIGAIAEQNTEALVEAVRPNPDFITDADEPRLDELLGGAVDDEDVERLDADVPEGAFGTPEADKDNEDESFDDVDAKMQGILALNEDLDLRGQNWYGIPELLSNKLLESFPEPLDTWAGKDATPDDGMTNWLYNYGVAPFSGLPAERAIMSFFTFDEKFECWWDYPAFYTMKMIKSKMIAAICPDFSFYDIWPRVRHIEGVYRSHWLGRYFQEAGVKVIPRFQYQDEESLKFNLTGIPVGTPTLACSVQNVDRHEDKDSKGHSKAMRLAGKVIGDALELVKPKEFLVYGGGTSKTIINEIVKPTGMKVLLVDNYVAKRRGVVFDKKEGAGSLGKQNKLKKRLKKQMEQEPEEAED